MTDCDAQPAAAVSGQISPKFNTGECEETRSPAKSDFGSFQMDDFLRGRQNTENVSSIFASNYKEESQVSFSVRNGLTAFWCICAFSQPSCGQSEKRNLFKEPF